MGENHFTPALTSLYGVVLLMAAIAYWILQCAILVSEVPGCELAVVVGKDFKGKISPLI